MSICGCAATIWVGFGFFCMHSHTLLVSSPLWVSCLCGQRVVPQKLKPVYLSARKPLMSSIDPSHWLRHKTLSHFLYFNFFSSLVIQIYLIKCYVFNLGVSGAVHQLNSRCGHRSRHCVSVCGCTEVKQGHSPGLWSVNSSWMIYDVNCRHFFCLSALLDSFRGRASALALRELWFGCP